MVTTRKQLSQTTQYVCYFVAQMDTIGITMNLEDFSVILEVLSARCVSVLNGAF